MKIKGIWVRSVRESVNGNGKVSSSKPVSVSIRLTKV